MAYGAMGAAAGLVGGALLMHEGEEVKDHWKRDEYIAEDKYDDMRDDIRRDEYRADEGFDRFKDRVSGFTKEHGRAVC